MARKTTTQDVGTKSKPSVKSKQFVRILILPAL